MPWTLAVVLTIFPPLAAINYYVGRKIFESLARVTSWDRHRLRLVCISGHVIVNLLPIVYLLAYVLSGRASAATFSGDNRAVDYFLSYPFWAALVIFIQLFVVFALIDAIELLVLRRVHAAELWWKSRRAITIVIVSSIVGVYSAATIILDTWTVRIVERRVSLPERFKSLRGFRIAEISDVQGDGRTNYQDLRAYVAKVNSLHPDIVFFAGDLVTSGTRYIDSTARILGGLSSKFGTYAALGDHDIWSNKAMVVKALRSNGIRVLEDSTITLTVDSSRLALSVVTFTYPERPTTGQLESLMQSRTEGYRIMLAHQPAESLVRLAQQHGYQLLLAGHTHGGGIAFGIPGFLLLAPASFETRYTSGMYRLGDMIVSVTNGLGLTLAPIRFNAPAEVVLVRFQ